MKDIIISGTRLHNELEWLGMSFLLAVALNAFAIYYYHTRWIELLTMLHVEFGLALVFNCIALVGRVMGYFGHWVMQKLINE
ncbi:hypothetical protein JW960_20910 [candidate division KSB1 bacterium]|nr:hypothetical protein [candidate division KSB1 bacterium]